jgi:hypothetical protein
VEAINQPNTDLCRQDLITVLAGLRRTNAHLLTASESFAIQGMIDLPVGAGRLLAQLLARRHSCLRLKATEISEPEDQKKNLDFLLKNGFLVEIPHSATRTGLFTKKELSDWCNRCGVDSKGKKSVLVQRISELPEGPPGQVVHVVHRALVDWCEWIYFGGGRGRRNRFVLERIGISVWSQYPLTAGLVAFDNRNQLNDFLAYEAQEPLSVPDLLGQMASLPERAPSHRNFDLRRRMGKDLLHRAGESESNGDTELSLFLYEQALALRVGEAAEIQRRRALCLESLGKIKEAALVCQSAIVDAHGEQVLALHRTGRRLSRTAGVPWIPPAPLLKPKVRTVGLRNVRVGVGANGGIETRVAGLFPDREMVHAEGRLWTSLFVLLFFDLLWMPVNGMLPAPCLDGPLDLGRKEFAIRRRKSFAARLKDIRKGGGRKRMDQSLKQRGVRIKGMDWGLATDSQWRRMLASLPVRFVEKIMTHLGEAGFSGAAGLPDLFVWPGKQQRKDYLFPSIIGPGVHLVEIKGPNDNLQDNQRVWHDRLLRWKFPVEIWRVEELDYFYANHGRTTQRTKTTPSKRRDGATHFRPGPGGTLFYTGAGPEGV